MKLYYQQMNKMFKEKNDLKIQRKNLNLNKVLYQRDLGDVDPVIHKDLKQCAQGKTNKEMYNVIKIFKVNIITEVTFYSNLAHRT